MFEQIGHVLAHIVVPYVCISFLWFLFVKRWYNGYIPERNSMKFGHAVVITTICFAILFCAMYLGKLYL